MDNLIDERKAVDVVSLDLSKKPLSLSPTAFSWSEQVDYSWLDFILRVFSNQNDLVVLFSFSYVESKYACEKSSRHGQSVLKAVTHPQISALSVEQITPNLAVHCAECLEHTQLLSTHSYILLNQSKLYMNYSNVT